MEASAEMELERIRWAVNRLPKSEDPWLDVMSLDRVAKGPGVPPQFPPVFRDPPGQLEGDGRPSGAGGLYVKDESYRFRLNAFKVLGGSFAMGKYIAGRLGRDVSELDYDYLTGERFRREFGQATFFTATDGNHGAGRGLGGQQAGSESGRPHAQGQLPRPLRQHCQGGRRRHHRGGQLRRMCAHGGRRGRPVPQRRGGPGHSLDGL